MPLVLREVRGVTATSFMWAERTSSVVSSIACMYEGSEHG